MNNDMQLDSPSFDYAAFFDADETSMLKEAEYAIRGDLNQAGECLIRVGIRLAEIKEQLGRKGKGEGFVAWCNSERFPLSYQRACEYIAVAREVQGEKINSSLFLSAKGPGHKALAMLSKMKDEQIKQAMIEHTSQRIESGDKVSQKEVVELTKALKDAQAKAKELEDKEFDARQALEKLKIERDKLAEREKEAREKKDQYARDLIEADKQRKATEADYRAKLQAKQQELKDAEEVHREHLETMRRKIAEEERNRPRADAEEAEHQAKLKALQDEAARAQTALNTATKDKAALERELNDLRKEVALRDKVLNDWGTASIGFREVALRLTGSTDGLKRIPLTDELYSQIKMIRELAATIVTKLDEVTHVG